MDVRVNDDEFAILKWLHDKHEHAAPDVDDFLASALREQLNLEEVRYNRARDYLQHFELVQLREAEVEPKKKVEAIKLSPDGENFYRHAVAEPHRYRFDAKPDSADGPERIPSGEPTRGEP